MIRVRFAPSPTGYLHIGGARTALYNWLFARKRGGKFLLRIEDTDVKRSSDELSKAIIESLLWIGLDFDEDIIYQSDRFDIYKKYAFDLLEKGLAYRCFCSEDELEERRERAIREKKAWKYDRVCCKLTKKEIKQYEEQGKPFAIRFKVPEKKIIFNDLVQGEVEFHSKEIEDFVILRSNGLPTYHLSAVVDDIEMGITHIIRGADHLTNTPKHILLFEALEMRVPDFAHLPLILGPDHKRLSKRHAAVSVFQYKQEGFLPEALINYLALLGWSPGDNREILSKDELIELFELKEVNKRNPIFDFNKLKWMNSQYIKNAKADDLIKPIKDIMEAKRLWREEFVQEKRIWFIKVIDLLKVRVNTITELLQFANPIMNDEYEIDGEAEEKYLKDEKLPIMLQELISQMKLIGNFNEKIAEELVRGIAEKHSVKAGILIHALRVILTGRSISAGIFETMDLIGKARLTERIERWLCRK